LQLIKNKNKMSRIEKSLSRKEEMFQFIDRQIESGISQIRFCKKQKMSIATFGYWRKKYLNEKNTPSPGNFVALKIKPPPENNCPIEIQLPNKIILRCADWQSDQLSTLIFELQKIELPC